MSTEEPRQPSLLPTATKPTPMEADVSNERGIDSSAQSPPPDSADAPSLERALARLGHTEFRPGQREAVETLLGPGKLLLVAPTGGGKSLCYQLPALLLPGTTLVISPLIALMRDQVFFLESRGIRATYLASTLEPQELDARVRSLRRGEYQLAYVAPERLVHPAFRALLRELACPLVAVDEAHCISEWGHDFRPEYLQIGEVLKELPSARVLACTATATPFVRDEILARLNLPPETPQLVRGFARPNLSLRVVETATGSERAKWVDAALAEALGEPGSGAGTAIVYAPTRRTSESEAARLSNRGWRADAYHAGLGGERRDEVHSEFATGRLEVVVATNAFGMGIDRPDVRAVLHLAPPGSIEAYYQEVGRAGRDGAPALALMLLGPGDMARRRHLIDADVDGTQSPDAVAHRWSLFLELMRFAEGGSCRHDAVLRYFGDEEETLAGCGRCDVCQQLDGGDEEAISHDEKTLLVRKALSGVARVHGRYGLSAAVALLRGAKDPRLSSAGLDRTTTHGVLAEHAEDWLTRLLRRCITAGWVDFLGGDRPVVVLTEQGLAVMKGERPVRLLLPPTRRVRVGTASTGRRRTGGSRAPVSPDVLSEQDEMLFEALRDHRLEVARADGVPPYVVASDRTLRDIATLRPRNREELLLAHGIGEAKADRFGAGLLSIVEAHAPIGS